MELRSHVLCFTFRAVARLMLTYDPNTRPSAGDLLTHKWLTASATAPVGRVAKALPMKIDSPSMGVYMT